MTELEALRLIVREYRRAKAMHPRDYASPHEGFAIVREEVDELWDEIKRNSRHETTIEATHVGATILRFLIEVCHEVPGGQEPATA